MIGYVIVAVLWVIGIPITYFKYLKYWTDNTKFEKIWFSCLWPCMIPLYIIHLIYNKGHNGNED